VDRREREGGAVFVHVRAELLPGLLVERADLAGVGQVKFAEGTQRHPARAAVKKLAAQLRFQRLDVLGERGLRHVQPQRRLAEIQALREDDELLKIVDLHLLFSRFRGQKGPAFSLVFIPIWKL